MLLSSSIPDTYSSLSSLDHVDWSGLRNNVAFSGTLPRSLQGLSSLSVLYMQKARISGTLHNEQTKTSNALTAMTFSFNLHNVWVQIQST